MKILILNYEYPPLGGGAGIITMHIAKNFAKRGNIVVVVTAWYNGLSEIEPINNNLEIIRLKSKPKFMHRSFPLEMYSWMKMANKFLSTYLKNNRFDICLANFSIPGGYVAKNIKKKFGLPYCILSHGHDIPWYYPRQMFFYHLILYFIIRSVCLKSLLNFVQTTFMKQNIDRFTGKRLNHKNIIIPNGIEPFKNLLNDRAKQPFTIIFVGRFVNQKDTFTLLKALKELKRMDIPFRLFMVGDGPLRKKMEKFVKKNDFKDTVFTGWIPQEQVQSYYQKSHIMVTPSRAEGMSIANMEALAAGVFLITTPVSGNREMLSYCKNGVLVEPENYNEIANQIQNFYFKRYLSKKLNTRNYANQFTKQYNWEIIAERYEQEFEKSLLLGKNPV